ncbi:alanine racemase [Luteimonas sp. RD2P54]|uniref:Alanine racemase n=1 Tax=Luteimonas endophytica TaxID=3042023 RepID=A0ABT6JAX5_9GAMM|nr:alanine racemase [Luteimonas endophytica]MDH5823982.1 alanine racemase [Luteimonas endophytica]
MPLPSPLSEPALLLDEVRVRRNLDRMTRRAAAAGVRLRPHFKTHQSHAVGRWFREAGVEAITVSSLAMAEYFVDDGWHDITLAFPFHPGMQGRVEALAQRAAFGIVLADAAALEGVRFSAPLDVWLKIDVGSHRTGLDPDDVDGLRALAASVAGRGDVRLRGLLAHAGHSYAARDTGEILAVHEQTLMLLGRLREDLAGCGPLEISVGDTPTCSIAESFSGASEIRPGNFAFYDLMQWQIGSCDAEDIAVAMACPVVARHPARGELVVHGGAVHFSKDALALDGERVFGLAVNPAPDGWGELQRDVRLVRLSQEHGIVSAPADVIARTRPGDPLLFLPVHSCLTADAMGRYRTLAGESIGMMGRGHRAS